MLTQVVGTSLRTVSPLSLPADVVPVLVDENRAPRLAVAGVHQDAAVVADAAVREREDAGGVRGAAGHGGALCECDMFVSIRH